jgi:hypothetical protein
LALRAPDGETGLTPCGSCDGLGGCVEIKEGSIVTTKAEAEPLIRILCHQWATETGAMAAPGGHPSFSAFTS